MAETVYPNTRRTILIIDHDDLTRASIRRSLESRGYRVLDAADSSAADQVMAVYVAPIHLFLINIDAAGVSTVVLADRLSSVRAEARLLVMSHHPQRAAEHKARPEQELPFIRRPFASDELHRAVRRLLKENGA